MTKNEPKDNGKSYLGHRSRVRAGILENGIESLQEYQILEYILFQAIPRKDTKNAAHALINKFGTFHNVLLAEVDDLAAVPDMTRNAALFLHSLPGILTVFQKSKTAPKSSFTSDTMLPYLKSLFLYETEECLQLLCFDAKRHLLHVDKLTDGTPQSVTVSVKQITEIAFRYHAASVMLAHNHPSDNVYPSDADRHTTAAVHKLLEDAMGITVLDHVIIGTEYAWSFAMRSRVKIDDGSYPINTIRL